MIAVLDYGIGNLGSAQKALRHVGADAQLIAHPEGAIGARGVVLPGVGAFGACMDALRRCGLDAVVYEAVAREIPFLGICVGLQLLYDASEESPGVAGLGIIGGKVRRMAGTGKLPHMQWNVLDRVGFSDGSLNRTSDCTLDKSSQRPSSALLEGLDSDAWYYFVHSYAAEPTNEVVATCEYGGAAHTAVVERGRLWATQFHPEKSSTEGLRLLANFVELAQ